MWKKIEYLKEILKNNNIEDIYLTGFIDIEDGIAQFYHDLRFVYFGINIGGDEQKQMWKINLKESENVKETYIKISDK